MLPPILLHPGFPRSATSTLQASLARDSGNVLFCGRSKKFAYAGWLLPSLADVFSQIAAGQMPSDKSVGEMREQLWEKVQATGARLIFMSDERLSKPRENRGSDWRTVQAEQFREVFQEPSVLLTIRNQPDLMESMYNLSRLHNPELGAGFEDWLHDGGGSRYGHWRERFDFYAYYTAMAVCLGKEKCHVAKFEEYTVTPSTVETILRSIQPDVQLSLNFTKKVYATRQNGSPVSKLGRLALSKIGIVRAPFKHVPVDERGKSVVREQFARGNRLLEAAAGIDLTGYY